MTTPGHSRASEAGTGSRDASPGYLPKLDGFRAFAILAVMLFHANWLPCGWIGVQAFFVLSGFLITRILLRSRERCVSPSATGRTAADPAEYFLVFYWRRFLRIFPLYYAFVAVLAAACFTIGHPAQLKSDLAWVLTYTTNIRRIFPGYHDADFYSHLWSLAIEEQFYFIWPAVVWLLPQKPLRRLIWALIFAGPLLRLVAGLAASSVSSHPTYAGEVVYNLLTSHLDAFAAGAAVAAGIGFFKSGIGRKLIGLAALTLTLGMVMLWQLRSLGYVGFKSFGYPHDLSWNYQYVWGYSLLNLNFALLIALLLQPVASAGRDPFCFLAWPAIVYLGRISYGLYIFHAPVQALINHFTKTSDITPLSAPVFLLSSTTSVAIAAISFHFMESRFLKLKDRRPWAAAFAPALSTSEAATE
jgi:peptidoglycan/LPS O-acetylase OafA/YrhL